MLEQPRSSPKFTQGRIKIYHLNKHDHSENWFVGSRVLISGVFELPPPWQAARYTNNYISAPLHLIYDRCILEPRKLDQSVKQSSKENRHCFSRKQGKRSWSRSISKWTHGGRRRVVVRHIVIVRVGGNPRLVAKLITQSPIKPMSLTESGEHHIISLHYWHPVGSGLSRALVFLFSLDFKCSLWMFASQFPSPILFIRASN
ncbi:uncharacterized protein EI90DRAFT_1531866 [Cantharellus anzutake]|uniref:uncharacterized protein n=1 Tax=Cantharellus anzutake TaxID=1750568 RepID=UPI001907186C|nr:uncharacterized protein EI90DRAFT_1531866 [Cantharellus anzutake]KAF8328528.1 hypothetical protein EI90DRAFT_1531866 [Cantharellus anzutake]